MSCMSPFSDLRLGTDLVWIPRLSENHRRYGEAFFARLLTPDEMDYCRRRGGGDKAFIRHAAGRIALKEAISKALGVGINGLGWRQGVSWQAMEIVSRSQQPPELHLNGTAQEIANRLGVRQWRLSLSHEGDYAMATAVALIQE